MRTPSYFCSPRFLSAHHNMKHSVAVGMVVGLVLVTGAWAENVFSGTQGTVSSQGQTVVQKYMAGPSVFIENAGQWADNTIRYALDGAGANVGITERGPRFQLFRRTDNNVKDKAGDVSPEPDLKAPPTPSEMHEFGLVFDGAAPVAPVGRGISDRKFNYLVGDPATHREGVGSFNAVWYENLYPGVGLELTGRRTGLKYNFHVAPGGDYRAIRLLYEGIEGVSLRDDGALEICIMAGWERLTDGAPYIYQEVNGEKKTVAGRFVLFGDRTYGFEVTGAYDATLPLVIDPDIAWSTYLGDTGTDQGYGVGVDSSGNCYAAGQTESSGWVSGGGQTTYAGNFDVFVVKLNAAGQHVWSTYLGGTAQDTGMGIAVDSGGNSWVTGITESSGWVSGGWQTTYGGGLYDSFVVKLNAAGVQLWSTYLGGSGMEQGFSIAVDSSGNSYATGITVSDGWVSGGWNTTRAGDGDGYAVKLDSAGQHVWSTYMGGASNDYGYGIAADSNGNCFVAGVTATGNWTSGGYDTVNDGYDAYLVKLNATGQHAWSTFVGGTSETDIGRAVAVDSSGDCYVVGDTRSPGWVSGGWLTTFGGSYDGFAVKVSSAGAHLWSTYLGGANEDAAYGVAVDASGGHVWITGNTYSAGWVNGGWQTTLPANYTYEGFLVKLNTAGTHLWSSYFGGSSSEVVRGVAVDSTGSNAWIAGSTYSSDWISGGWDTTYGGAIDAFVMKVTDAGQTGSIQVTLAPPGAAAAGAQWRPVGTSTWLNSGDTAAGLAVGVSTVEFKDVYGWAPPASHELAVTFGGTTAYTGTYTAVPVDMSWSTYLGGIDEERGEAIAVDANGDCYATGSTESSGWVSGGWDTTHAGYGHDAYVVKLTAGGAHVWSTYIGGGATDYGLSIAVDASGDCYAAGYTASPDWVSGGGQTTLSGTGDGYVVKLDSAGAHVWSTYVGGTSGDECIGIAVDSGGSSYVTGDTGSENWASGGWDTTLGAGGDGFAAKLDPAGVQLWSTYVGGEGMDAGHAIAVDSSGNCCAVGYTNSTGWVSNGWDLTFNATLEGYAVKLSPSGGHIWSTYLGDVGNDGAFGVAVDSSGNWYVAGHTTDAGWISGGWDGTPGGGHDAFVVKLSAAGAHLWSSAMGGAGTDSAYAIAVDASGSCYLTGSTLSDGWVSGGGDTILNTGTPVSSDAFVVKLSSIGEHVWSTFLGGTGSEYGNGIAVNSAGTNVWVTGTTSSPTWVINGWHTNYGSKDDAFVANINATGTPLAPSNPGSTAIGTDTITWTWQDNSIGETGFNVYDGPGAGLPSTLQFTTGADTQQWQHNGLSANVQYAFQVCAANTYGESPKTMNYTAWTLIEAVTGLTFTGVGPNSIGVASTNTPSNLAGGVSGLYFENITMTTNSGWKQDNNAWVSPGLSPNTQYAFTGVSRNGVGVVTSPLSASKYTLAATAVAPQVGNPGVHTLDVTIGSGDGNPAPTLYAIQVSPGVGSNTWVQGDGTVGASPVFLNATVWGTKTVTGLAEFTPYAFTVTARNAENVDAPAGPSSTGMTRDGTPPTGTPALSSMSPTGANIIHFTMAFNEPVAPTFDSADVTLSGTLGGIVSVTGTPPNYLVSVALNEQDTDGTVGIIVGNDVTDLAGNAYAGGASELCQVYNWRGFLQEPQDAKGYTGDDFVMNVVPNCGANAFTYLWKWDNGAVHDGPTTASWSLTDVPLGNAGEYWCEVRYAGGAYPTTKGTLTLANHLEIVQQPVGGDVNRGDSYTFAVTTAGGYGPLSFQWKKDGLEIEGATNDTYTICSLDPVDSGVYSVDVEDSYTDSVVSGDAQLNVSNLALPVLGGAGVVALIGLIALGSARKTRSRLTR